MKHFSFKRLSKLLAAALSVSAVMLVFAPFSFAESTEEFYADLLGEMGISAPVEAVFANEAPVITFTEEDVYSPVEESIYEFVPSEDPMQYADTSVWPGGQICFEDLDYADSSSWNGGRLVIGGVGINVGLYSEGGDAQAVTDAYDWPASSIRSAGTCSSATTAIRASTGSGTRCPESPKPSS